MCTEISEIFPKIKESGQISKKVVSRVTVNEFEIKMCNDDEHCVRTHITVIT
jgi:hypothetical protein